MATMLQAAPTVKPSRAADVWAEPAGWLTEIPALLPEGERVTIQGRTYILNPLPDGHDGEKIVTLFKVSSREVHTLARLADDSIVCTCGAATFGERPCKHMAWAKASGRLDRPAVPWTIIGGPASKLSDKPADPEPLGVLAETLTAGARELAPYRGRRVFVRNGAMTIVEPARPARRPFGEGLLEELPPIAGGAPVELAGLPLNCAEVPPCCPAEEAEPCAACLPDDDDDDDTHQARRMDDDDTHQARRMDDRLTLAAAVQAQADAWRVHLTGFAELVAEALEALAMDIHFHGSATPTQYRRDLQLARDRDYDLIRQAEDARA